MILTSTIAATVRGLSEGAGEAMLPLPDKPNQFVSAMTGLFGGARVHIHHTSDALVHLELWSHDDAKPMAVEATVRQTLLQDIGRAPRRGDFGRMSVRRVDLLIVCTVEGESEVLRNSFMVPFDRNPTLAITAPEFALRHDEWTEATP